MAEDTKHILSHINFNGDSIDIQDAIARQTVSEVSKQLSELTKNAVTNVTQGISDYTIRVTKDGLAIDVPITGLSSKLDELQGRLTNFLDSEDPQLDSLSEIIAYIQSNRSSIQDLVTDKVDVDSIVDNLTSTDASKVLSAKQGNSLKALIDAISTSISNVDNTSDSSKPVSTAQQDAINAAYANATKYADTKIADLIDGAPETMDTLKEVAEAIQVNKDVETALNEAIGKKANQAELDTHVNNTTIHITASERANYQTAYEHSRAEHARADATKVEKSTTNGNILIDGVESNVYSHPGTGTNPHGTTKADIGLQNVGNFKAVSTVANQGLTDDEKAAARTNMGAQIAGSYASSMHNHDDRYQAKGSYASASHTHDDRYYTESEMNTKLGGKVDSSADGVNNAINKLSIGTDTPSDADYYVSQYAGGGGINTTYHRRPVSALWSYIKSKADKVYATLTHTHTKSQIIDFPTSMPANGGDASTVNGHTVGSNVPANARFTDTVLTKVSELQNDSKYQTDTDVTNALIPYATIENLKGSGTIEINGANITKKSINADKLNIAAWGAFGVKSGGFIITKDDITTSGETMCTALSSKPLTDNTSYGALVSYQKLSSAGTYYGSYIQTSRGILEAGTISGKTPIYTPSFIVEGDSVTLEKIDTTLRVATEYGLGASLTNYSLQISPTSGNHMNIGQRTIQAVTKDNTVTNLYLNSYGGNVQLGNASSNMTFGGANSTSIKIANKELIGVFKGTTPTIVTRTLTLNTMSLAGNYDGETTGTIKSVSGYVVLAVIPRTSDATDVCWINCYFDSSNVVHARLKNTVSSAKNNFKPTVEVLYRLI